MCVFSYWFKTESGILKLKKILKEEYSGLLTPYGSIFRVQKKGVLLGAVCLTVPRRAAFHTLHKKGEKN